MFFRLFAKKGQSTAEYAILIGIVIAAAVGIQTYVKRGLQARFKTTVDTFVHESAGGDNAFILDSTTALDNLQFEHEDYKAKSTQVVSNADRMDSLYKAGDYERISTETQQLGESGDYRVYEYPKTP